MLKLINDIFQFVSLSVTSVLGITNLFGEYKDKKGNITVYGRRALKWIIVSSIISIITFCLDRYIKHNEELADNKKTLESLKRSEKIIADINRGLNPIKDVLLSYRLNLDFNKFPELKAYKERLRIGLLKLVPEFIIKKSDTKVNGVWVEGFYGPINDRHYIFSIWQDSPLFPNKAKEPLAYAAVMEQMATLYFYRNPINIQQSMNFGAFNGNTKSEKKCDLLMEFDTNRRSTFYIEYDVYQDQITVEAEDLASDPKLWISSGNLMAIPDLSNAQLFLAFGQPMISFSTEDEKKIIVPDMTSLTISMSDGKRLELKNEIRKYKFPKETVYEYQFPADVDSLFRKNLFF